jgi:hypothetical protein
MKDVMQENIGIMTEVANMEAREIWFLITHFNSSVLIERIL